LRQLNFVIQILVTLVTIAGLVWAVAVWKVRRRRAVLVAAACALQVAIRLLWLPATRFVFGDLAAAGPVQRFFILGANALSQLSLAVSLGLLIYAALSADGRKQ
jgi:hypothetical protein